MDTTTLTNGVNIMTITEKTLFDLDLNDTTWEIIGNTADDVDFASEPFLSDSEIDSLVSNLVETV